MRVSIDCPKCGDRLTLWHVIRTTSPFYRCPHCQTKLLVSCTGFWILWTARLGLILLCALAAVYVMESSGPTISVLSIIASLLLGCIVQLSYFVCICTRAILVPVESDVPMWALRFSLRSLILLIVLAGSGYGLWVKWEPWGLLREIQPTDAEAQTISIRRESYSPDRTRRIWMRGNSALIQERSVNGTILHTFPPLRYDAPSAHSPAPNLRTRWVCHFLDDDTIVYGSTVDHWFVWRKHHPEQWWGVTWLPEFWLTVVLSFGLLWSVWGDQTKFRSARIVPT